MNLDQSTATAAADLLRQVGFPVLTAAYFMWRDQALIKDLVKGNAENRILIEAIHDLLEKRGD